MTIRFTLTIPVVVMLWLGCTKDPGLDQVGVQLRFVNVSPDASALQVTLNETKAFTPALAYMDTTTYLQFAGGTYQLSVQVNSLAPSNTVLDFIPKKSYTFFVADSARKAKLTILQDDLTLPTLPLRTKVRFLNFIPNSGALLLFGIANADTMALGPGRSFNNASGDVNIDVFNTIRSEVYELVLVSNNRIVSRLPLTTLQNDKIYTIYAQGMLGSLGNSAPTLKLISHN